MIHPRMRSVIAVVWTCNAVLTGCNSYDGPPRIDVSGDVTWKGKPVPSGFITFSPDVTKGNSGPQGVAWIRDGKFDTRWKKGRGASSGDQFVQIFGYDGVNPSEENPYGAPLFVRHETTLTVKEPAEPITLVVPDSTAAAPRN